MNKLYKEGTYFLTWEDEFLSDTYQEVYQVFDIEDKHIDERSAQDENYLLYEKLQCIFKDKYEKGKFSIRHKEDGNQLVFDLD